MSNTVPGNVSSIPISDSRDNRQLGTCVRSVRSVTITVHRYGSRASRIPTVPRAHRLHAACFPISTKHFSVSLFLLIPPVC